MLEARMVSGLQIESSSAKMDVLKSTISGTASTTRSQSAQSARSVEREIRAMVASASSCVIRSLDTSFPSDRSMVARPLSTYACSMSIMVTLYPAAAATCVIPFPICPAPRTAMLWIVMYCSKRKQFMKLRIYKVARLGFEPRSAGPKPTMMDHYTKGLASFRHRSNISTNPSYRESSGSESSVHFLQALRARPHFLIGKANQWSICQSKSISSGWLIWIIIEKPRYMMSFLSRFMNRS